MLIRAARGSMLTSILSLQLTLGGTTKTSVSLIELSSEEAASHATNVFTEVREDRILRDI